MRKIALTIAVAVLLAPLAATDADAAARDHKFPVKHAQDSKSGKKLLDVPFYMKGQEHPAVKTKMGEFKTNKKTNGFRKEDQEACDHAFVSAIIALQQRAQREGGNAVIDIYSITRDVEYVDAEKYSCQAGNTVVHVALMGTVATLE